MWIHFCDQNLIFTLRYFLCSVVLYSSVCFWCARPFFLFFFFAFKLPLLNLRFVFERYLLLCVRPCDIIHFSIDLCANIPASLEILFKFSPISVFRTFLTSFFFHSHCILVHLHQSIATYCLFRFRGFIAFLHKYTFCSFLGVGLSKNKNPWGEQKTKDRP